MHILELPTVFMDMKSLCMIMLMLFPTISKKARDSRQFCDELELYYSEIRMSCFEIFKENNVKKRTAFFSEPLIKYLWKLFIVYKPEVIIHHLRRIRSYPYEGEMRYRTLISDMHVLENLHNVKILPEYARNSYSITLFT